VLRKEKTAVGDGGAHSFTAFPHGGIGQANQGHPFQPTGNIHFHVDGFCI